MIPRQRSKARGKRPAKDVLLVQLVLLLMRGETLTHERLRQEFYLERRSAERRLKDLKDLGLPVVAKRAGREASYALDAGRAKLNIEAVDVPPKFARALSLLVVAARLLPANLGIHEAIDATVRAALRLRGLKASAELRRASDAVLVLESDAKDYTGKQAIFDAFVDAVLEGRRVTAKYRSPRKRVGADIDIYCASIGLYKGGLYVLGVDSAAINDVDALAHWYALERFDDAPQAVNTATRLPPHARLRAVDDARARWGPAARHAHQDKPQVVALRFTKEVAPYVRARRWHDAAEWEDQRDGTIVMSMRINGETGMFESWVKSWGHQVQVLRPLEMAERIAQDLQDAAHAHRAAAAQFAAALRD